MSAFLAAVLSFPTVIFTIVLVAFILYAAATLLGALDIEALDGLLGIDDVEDTFLESLLHGLGLSGIPVTIFGGIAGVFAWLTSFVADRFLPDGAVIDGGIALGAAFTGLVLGALVLRPLRNVFNPENAQRNREMVGKICTIRSLRVDGASGTAEVEDGSAGYIAEVRCFRENEMTRGSKAIVYDYDEKSGVYHVGPLDPSITADPLETITATTDRQEPLKAKS